MELMHRVFVRARSGFKDLDFRMVRDNEARFCIGGVYVQYRKDKLETLLDALLRFLEEPNKYRTLIFSGVSTADSAYIRINVGFSLDSDSRLVLEAFYGDSSKIASLKTSNIEDIIACILCTFGFGDEEVAF